MAKDKKKKKKDKKEKKAAKNASSPGLSSLKALAQNPLVADIVAAALVSTAAALKDSKKARRLASEAEDELIHLSKAGAEKGNALWELALEVGRRSLKALSAEAAPKRAKAEPDGAKRPRKKQPAAPAGD